MHLLAAARGAGGAFPQQSSNGRPTWPIFIILNRAGGIEQSIARHECAHWAHRPPHGVLPQEDGCPCRQAHSDDTRSADFSSGQHNQGRILHTHMLHYGIFRGLHVIIWMPSPLSGRFRSAGRAEWGSGPGHGSRCGGDDHGRIYLAQRCTKATHLWRRCCSRRRHGGRQAARVHPQSW